MPRNIVDLIVYDRFGDIDDWKAFLIDELCSILALYDIKTRVTNTYFTLFIPELSGVGDASN